MMDRTGTAALADRTGAAGPPRRPRRGLLVAVAAIGLGLAAAPAVFSMFTRAPEGGRMIDDFRPHMTEAKVARFQRDLAEIGRADAEVADRLAATPGSTATIQELPALAELHRRWPGIDADMGDMLATMADNVDNFAAVDALPPFALFPWFFVLPGLLAAALAGSALRAEGRGGRPRGRLGALAVLGLGIAAAPAAFSMFERAPEGGRMIDDFRPLMTEAKVTAVQGYFLTIGAAEGELRTKVLAPASPAAPAAPAAAPAAAAAPLPAATAFVGDWPRISNEMAPMIGAMADNVDNFAAVDALPPFALFPWFFVAPGLLVTALAVAAGRRRLAGRAALVALAGVLAGCGGGGGEAAAGTPLRGLFRISPGTCTAGGVSSGSWFRMAQPGGTVAAGPFVVNGDSPCGDKTWTPLRPGTDGGLVGGSYQPQADPPFDGGGQATSGRITEPQAWFAVRFALATNRRDPQAGRDVPAPRLVARGRTLGGDLSAFAASWNGQHFNQGAPKPGGRLPGTTRRPKGTYDPTSRAYTLEWSSQIVGGPFNNFTGIWHLEGTFEPR